MSLIKCPECAKEISNNTNECIYCGYRLKKEVNIKNNSKVIIHSYNDPYLYSPAIKVYNNGEFITEINKGQTISLSIDNDTIFTFKHSNKSIDVKVLCNRITEIQLFYTRGVALRAITNIQGKDAESNVINNKTFQETIRKQKAINNIWITIAIILIIIGLIWGIIDGIQAIG
ncbi:MAG: zinc ribbon domain-containing protein [Firmicutes bacterium]|nr:zinc ribbon domain-containing protein [Bacillota bacterium]